MLSQLIVCINIKSLICCSQCKHIAHLKVGIGKQIHLVGKRFRLKIHQNDHSYFFVDVSVSIRDFHLMKVSSDRDRNVNKKVRIGCFDEFLI